MPLPRSCTALIFLAAAVLPLQGQTFGEITGTVTDPTGDVIAGANVTIITRLSTAAPPLRSTPPPSPARTSFMARSSNSCATTNSTPASGARRAKRTRSAATSSASRWAAG